MRDAYDKFKDNGIRLYAVSYDDKDILTEYAQSENIPFPLLSDIDSTVISRLGILNTQIKPDDGIFYGIPYPGVFVTDGDGRIIAKFFQNNYKKRDSAEIIIDAAMGRIQLSEDAPQMAVNNEEVKLTVTLHGGSGTLRQGLIRQIVVRFELREHLHIYANPVPEGIVPTKIDVSGPPGLVVGPPLYPTSQPLPVSGSKVDLQIWSGVMDVRIPLYANGELASEVRPLENEHAKIKINVNYQACNDVTCLLPKTANLELEVPLAVTDVPALPIHMGHGQREGRFDAQKHMQRLMQRKNSVGIDL